jgi:hypothetical protein
MKPSGMNLGIFYFRKILNWNNSGEEDPPRRTGPAMALCVDRIKISCPDSNRDWLLFVLRQKVTKENDLCFPRSF